MGAKFITSCQEFKANEIFRWDGKEFNSRKTDLYDDGGIILFQKKIKKKTGLESAVLNITALGVFEVYINGERIGNEELKPFWTDYNQRVFEFTYNIEDQLADGENTLLVQLSKGWYRGRISFNAYGDKAPAMRADITLSYNDGKTEKYESDESWLSCIGGRIRTADIWDGFYLDNTLPNELTNPEAYKFEKSRIVSDINIEVLPPVGEPLRVRKNLTKLPISSTAYFGTEDNGSEFGAIHVVSKKIGNGCEAGFYKKGTGVILDLGQEIVGRPVFTVKTKAGTKVKCYVAELLNDSGDPLRGNDGPKGSLYIKNYRSALARAVLVAGSDEAETCEPTHTYYGFRYLEITADDDFEIISVHGDVIGSDLRETGMIETDNDEVNRLVSNIIWGMRGNYFSNPTDCPQRDERLGWTGDTQIFCGAASYLADIKEFMHKWLGDLRCSQIGHDGAYCDVVPRVPAVGSGNTGWCDAGLIVPYRLWLMYNDIGILKEHYQSMEDYMQFTAKNGLDGGGLAYGDWLCYDDTDKRYIAICYYAKSAEIMEHFSNLLYRKSVDEGNSELSAYYKERAEYYKDLFSRIKAHFIETQTENGDLKQITQTSCILALSMHLCDGELYDKVKTHLKDKIVENDYTLTTGFLGTGLLCQTLNEIGEDNLSYSLLLQTNDPSWLYSVRQGATTVWERWNSYTLERGFGDVGMNSFNHYSYGAVLEWMFSGMAGIMPDKNNAGFTHFIYQPTPDTRTDQEMPKCQERIRSCKAHYDSCKGRIESRWGYENGRFFAELTVPKGTSATVKFPLLNGVETVTINDILFTASELGGYICRDCGRIVFEIREGKYKFN